MKKLVALLAIVSTSVFAQNTVSRISDINATPQNIAGGQFCTGDLLLNQPPNQSNGLFNDLDCDFCAGGAGGIQVMADNFVLTADNSLSEFVIYSGYFPGNMPGTDDWTLSIHADAAGVPGAVVFTESNVASTRTDTGVDLFGVDEFRVVLTLASPAALTAGTYWLEIHNNSVGNTDSVFWEVGDAGANSGPGLAQFATAFPSPVWADSTEANLAMQICAGAPDSDLQITKTSDAVGTVSQGDTVNYTLAVNNLGPGAATNVVVSDTLPINLTYISGSCDDGSAAMVAGQTVSFGLMDIAASATTTCSITTEVSGFGTIDNTASVTADNDANAANNSSAVSVAGAAQVIPTLSWYGILAMILMFGFIGLRLNRKQA